MKYARWAKGCGDPKELLKVVGTYEDGSVSLDILSGEWRHWSIAVQPSCLEEVPPGDLPEWLRREQGLKD
jgi:hypothetical protein